MVSKAKSENMTLTDLILERCLKNDKDTLPVSSVVSVLDSYNKIFHLIDATGNSQLTNAIKEIIQKNLSKINKEI